MVYLFISGIFEFVFVSEEDHAEWLKHLRIKGQGGEKPTPHTEIEQ